jgi:hypothetical protein
MFDLPAHFQEHNYCVSREMAILLFMRITTYDCGSIPGKGKDFSTRISSRLVLESIQSPIQCALTVLSLR